jgi:hypothetical protein
MASKSRFGYFSLLPSHTAAITDTSGSVRKHAITQPIGIQMEKFTLSFETYTQARPQLVVSRKTSSPTLLLPFMARLTSTLVKPHAN